MGHASPYNARRMPDTILVTGGVAKPHGGVAGGAGVRRSHAEAANPLGQAVRTALERAGYQVRTADAIDLTDPATVVPLVQGAHAIVHLAPRLVVETLKDRPGGDLLDVAARGTHVLYKAALEAGVTRAVQASTLAVMDAYDDDLEVTEQWRPRPAPEPRQLAPYLAELVAREFTRDVQLETPMDVICLRLAGFTHLAVDDAAQAIVGAVAKLREGGRRRGHRFRLYHVAPLTSEARYTSALAQRELGYATPSPSGKGQG